MPRAAKKMARSKDKRQGPLFSELKTKGLRLPTGWSLTPSRILLLVFLESYLEPGGEAVGVLGHVSVKLLHGDVLRLHYLVGIGPRALQPSYEKDAELVLRVLAELGPVGVVQHALELLDVGVELLFRSAYPGLLVGLALVNVARDRDVPVGRPELLLHAPSLQQHPSVLVEQEDDEGPMP